MRKAFLSAVIIILLSPVFAFSQGAINPQTGQYYPGTPDGGAINPQTGQYYPGGPGGGAINPQTGQYYPGGPGSGDGIAHDPQSGKMFHIVPPGNAAIDPETGRVYPVSGGIVIGYQKDEKVTQPSPTEACRDWRRSVSFTSGSGPISPWNTTIPLRPN